MKSFALLLGLLICCLSVCLPSLTLAGDELPLPVGDVVHAPLPADDCYECRKAGYDADGRKSPAACECKCGSKCDCTQGERGDGKCCKPAKKRGNCQTCQPAKRSGCSSCAPRRGGGCSSGSCGRRGGFLLRGLFRRR